MSSLWAWNVSALVYARTYGDLAHKLDEDVVAFLGDLKGKIVLDAGCGPGVVSAKLAAAGAEKVLCVDVTQGMLDQIPDDPKLVKVLARLDPGSLKPIVAEHAPNGVDVILFKRSLYHRPAEAEELLREAHGLLRPGGHVVVVHPERKTFPYAFGRPMRLHKHTPYHLFNRTISRIGRRVGAEDYTLHTRDELLELARRAAGGAPVSTIPSKQEAFNLVAISRPA